MPDSSLHKLSRGAVAPRGLHGVANPLKSGESPGSRRVPQDVIFSVRMNWQIKAVLPVVFVLLADCSCSLWRRSRCAIRERHIVLLVAERARSPFAPRCFSCSTYLVSVPWSNCRRKLPNSARADLTWLSALPGATTRSATRAATSIGWSQQLRESREEIEHLHRTQMSRAEHLATWESWLPVWRTRSEILWPELPESSRSSAVTCQRPAPRAP